MLQTLLKIGEWQSQGKSKWDRFLEIPQVNREDKHGNPIQNYTLPIIFDLDCAEVIIRQDNLKEYDAEAIAPTLPLKVKGGNNKAIYTAVPGKKLNQVYKTFFGKEDEETENGQLLEAIEKFDSSLLNEEFENFLSQIFDLKDEFLKQTVYETPTKSAVDIRAINEKFDLDNKENIAFINVYIKSQEFGFDKAVPFSEVPVYREFLEQSFFGKDEGGRDIIPASQKLCYASGEIADEVAELNLNNRYSLNKMFVTETKNYASVFDKEKFPINYQVSADNQEKLDYASDFLLKQGFKIRIANVDHVIIPQFLQSAKVDMEIALAGIHKKSDILFSLNRLQAVSESINEEIELDEIFWINFVAFESDGNFFKSTELIKDVSNFHFNKLIKTFNEIDWKFREADFVDWEAVMKEYDYDSKQPERRNFNFNTLFKIIPLRKDKEKKNKALDFFKTILEDRKVNKDLLFDYFVELILCHYYERYGSYTNVHHYSKDYFSIAVRDSIFKYLAFFQFLKKLKLIDMEETDNTTNEKSKNDYEKAILDFFDEMKLTQAQKAMFYLGKMLNTVEYIQKGKKKTVIQKVNFNGMDRDDIKRLRMGLMEKAKQYSAIGKVIFTDNKFGEHFNFNAWSLNPQEAVFFLLTGYSFGISSKDAETLEEKETEETL